jgi:hypothetical protein
MSEHLFHQSAAAHFAERAISPRTAVAMITSYEVGRGRVPVSLLPQIAETLTVSFEEVIGKKDVQPAKRGPRPEVAAADRAHPARTALQAAFRDRDARSVLAQANR